MNPIKFANRAQYWIVILAAFLGTATIIGIFITSNSIQAAVNYIFFKPIYLATMAFKGSAIYIKTTNPQNSLTELDLKIGSVMTFLLIFEPAVFLILLWLY